MLLKALRQGLGGLIAAIDQATRPEPLSRSAAAQDAVDRATEGMALYQFHGCPFCIRTRRALHRLNLTIPIRNVRDLEHRQALAEGGGAVQVPCLRIDDEQTTNWLYESADIIAYLERRFGAAAPASAGANAG